MPGMSDAATIHRLGPRNAHRLLGCAVFDHAVDAEELEHFVADPGCELVFATVEGVVVGFCSGSVLRHPDKPPAFFINEVGVLEAWRRRGIATALCREMLRLVRARGCKGIWLATEGDNAAARALYRGLRAREPEGIVVYDWDGAMDG